MAPGINGKRYGRKGSCAEWRHGPFNAGTISQLKPWQALPVTLSLRTSILILHIVSLTWAIHETIINFTLMSEVINGQDTLTALVPTTTGVQ